jgi:hypothetical protein
MYLCYSEAVTRYHVQVYNVSDHERDSLVRAVNKVAFGTLWDSTYNTNGIVTLIITRSVTTDERAREIVNNALNYLKGLEADDDHLT